MKKHQTGFTLIEISIVLVIIGLLAGGILKGQQMIENAKYKSFVKEIDAYRTAVTTFQDMYRALPGDYTKVDKLPGYATTLSTWKGNGNGVIDGTANASAESAYAICHLILAGLITGSCDSTITNQSRPTPVGGIFEFFATVSTGNSIMKNKMYFTSLPATVLQRLDEEFDDGKCTSGTISSTSTGCTATAWPAASTVVNAYIEI